MTPLSSGKPEGAAALSRDEAEFIGRVMKLDAKLAQIALGMLEKGHSLSYVVETYKAAVQIAQSVRK